MLLKRETEVQVVSRIRAKRNRNGSQKISGSLENSLVLHPSGAVAWVDRNTRYFSGNPRDQGVSLPGMSSEALSLGETSGFQAQLELQGGDG